MQFLKDCLPILKIGAHIMDLQDFSSRVWRKVGPGNAATLKISPHIISICSKKELFYGSINCDVNEILKLRSYFLFH